MSNHPYPFSEKDIQITTEGFSLKVTLPNGESVNLPNDNKPWLLQAAKDLFDLKRDKAQKVSAEGKGNV